MSPKSFLIGTLWILLYIPVNKFSTGKDVNGLKARFISERNKISPELNSITRELERVAEDMRKCKGYVPSSVHLSCVAYLENIRGSNTNYFKGVR